MCFLKCNIKGCNIKGWSDLNEWEVYHYIALNSLYMYYCSHKYLQSFRHHSVTPEPIKWVSTTQAPFILLFCFETHILVTVMHGVHISPVSLTCEFENTVENRDPAINNSLPDWVFWTIAYHFWFIKLHLLYMTIMQLVDKKKCMPARPAHPQHA